jgi:hypothetical protein
MIDRVFVLAVVFATMAGTALAQPKEPVGRFVADVRVASAGVPGEAGWTPALPVATTTPDRGLGVEIGAHVYVWRTRSFALGLGASWLSARGAVSPPEPGDGTPLPGTPPPSATPAVSTRFRTLTPQLSLNFGHSLGWSYLSAGLGRTRVESEATLAGSIIAPRVSDGVKTLNYGGGARWFLTDHLGVGFDVRWHKLSLVPASATHPGAPRASLLVAGAGIVVK